MIQNWLILLFFIHSKYDFCLYNIPQDNLYQDKIDKDDDLMDIGVKQK